MTTASPDPTDILSALRGGLVVSCQPVPGSPFDTVEGIVAYARAAETVGAAGLRVEGVANVAAVVKASSLPVVGIVKRDLDDSAVRITPFLEDVEALADAGAAIIAVDCTDRPRPVPSADLIAAIKRRGAIAMADLATEAEARAAIAAGVDIVGTTMSGYTGPVTPHDPDLELVEKCARLGATVIAEGRYNTPALAAAAIRAGAAAVTVGSAITRPEHVATWFREAIEAAAARAKPVLAFDIGGTKTLAALVCGREILDRRMAPTVREKIGAAGWIDGVAALAADWRGEYERAAVAVTGVVANGGWSSLNPGTLSIPPDFPLGQSLAAALDAPVEVVNDAQAAAWGEYRFGAGRRRDMAFLTVSSGIGGGIVLGGRLLRGTRGIAGSLGQSPFPGGGGFARLESRASGFAISEAARAAGHDADAAAVFAAAREGASWADGILSRVAEQLAAAIAGLQAIVDPDRIVIGGGVGLAEGFLERLEAALQAYPPFLVPALARAELGVDAGIVGAADLVGQD